MSVITHLSVDKKLALCVEIISCVVTVSISVAVMQFLRVIRERHVEIALH